MGKGAGTCGARSAMSLQADGGNKTSSAKPAAVKAFKRAEADAYYHAGVLDLARKAWHRAWWQEETRHSLEEFCQEIQATGSQQQPAMEAALDHLAKNGWIEKREFTPLVTDDTGSKQGKRVVDFQITTAGLTAYDDVDKIDNIIEERQRAYQLGDLAFENIASLATSKTCAPQLLDYLAQVKPDQPNQAHFAEQLGETTPAVSKAVKELLAAGLVYHHKGSNGNYWTQGTPTHYQLSFLGKTTHDLMQEQAAASPSMAALMAE